MAPSANNTLKFIGSSILIALFLLLVQQQLVVKKCTETALRGSSTSVIADEKGVDNRNASKIERTPGRCGIYYFYHVGKTGGTSIQSWQREIAESNPEKISFYLWADADPHPQHQLHDHKWAFTYQQIHQLVMSKDLSATSSWLSLHHHHNTPGLRYMMPRLREWKEALRHQGCDFFMSTVIREPLSRVKSIVSYNKIQLEHFSEFAARYTSQGRYILYNSCEARNDLSPPSWCSSSPGGGLTGQALSDQEMEEVLGYLSEFDIVKKMEALDDFVAESEALTGWKGRHTKAPKRNKSNSSDFEWTQEMYDMVAPGLKDDQALYDRLFG